jgi:serine/threonine protein kinase
MELLGLSLEAIMREGKVEFGTWLRTWKCGLRALETLHGMGYVHRDVKPANLAVDTREERVVLFDLGLGKAFLNSKTGEHFPDSDCETLAGTLLFSSLNVLKGIAHTPRDDLESLFLSLIYLSSGGKLPWKNPTRDQSKARKLYWTKQIAGETSLETLCAGMPLGILESLRYVKGLQYGDMPDYAYLLETAERCREELKICKEMSTNSLPEMTAAREKSSSSRKKLSHTPALAPVVLPLSPDPTEVLDWTTLRLSPRHRRLITSPDT